MGITAGFNTNYFIKTLSGMGQDAVTMASAVRLGTGSVGHCQSQQRMTLKCRYALLVVRVMWFWSFLSVY